MPVAIYALPLPAGARSGCLLPQSACLLELLERARQCRRIYRLGISVMVREELGLVTFVSSRRGCFRLGWGYEGGCSYLLRAFFRRRDGNLSLVLHFGQLSRCLRLRSWPLQDGG